MRALVLAAGLGTRLRPYTDGTPKPLFPVLGVPSIMWAIAGLRAAGVTDVVVNLHHLPDAIVAAIGNGAAAGIRVSYSREPRILGTGGAIVAARGMLDDGGPFLVHNSDIFHDWDLSRLVAGPTPSLAVVDGPGLPTADRRVEIGENGQVAALRGLPVSGRGRRVVYGGVAKVDGALVELLSRAMPDYPAVVSQSCLVADALIPMLSEGKPVGAVSFGSGWYCDTGTPESYLDLNFRALGNAAQLLGLRGFDPGQEVDRGVFVSGRARVGCDVRFVSPAMVCSGAVIGDGAIVGPRAVVSGRVENGSVVSDAVVLPGGVVRGARTGIVVAGEAANGR